MDNILEALSNLLPEEHVKDVATAVNGMLAEAKNEIEAEFNEKLEDAPDLINSDPYGEGWIIKIKLADTAELEELLSAEAYKELL